MSFYGQTAGVRTFVTEFDGNESLVSRSIVLDILIKRNNRWQAIST